VLLWWLGMLVAGIGVILGSLWARIFTLVLSGLGLVFGFVCALIGVLIMISPAGGVGGGNALSDTQLSTLPIVFAAAFLLIGHAVWAFLAVLLGWRGASASG